MGEVSDNRSVGMGKRKGGCGLFILGFFIISVYDFHFAFENQNEKCDKQKNIFF